MAEEEEDSYPLILPAASSSTSDEDFKDARSSEEEAGDSGSSSSNNVVDPSPSNNEQEEEGVCIYSSSNNSSEDDDVVKIRLGSTSKKPSSSSPTASGRGSKTGSNKSNDKLLDAAADIYAPSELSPPSSSKTKELIGKETDEEYRLLAYGNVEEDDDDTAAIDNRRIRMMPDDDDDKKPVSSPPPLRRRLSRAMSQQLLRRRSSLQEALPETPAGWTVLLAVVSSIVLGYEIQLQKTLTTPPLVYGQIGSNNSDDAAITKIHQIHQHLMRHPESIVQRPIHPSLFVGTRSFLSSLASYLVSHPASTTRFRQTLVMPSDGAEIALDWELPTITTTSTTATPNLTSKDEILDKTKTIGVPVVLILHGINNDAGFGYMRSLMRACTDKGWIAIGMNFRGCGGVKLQTPRGYTAAYTGDLRHVVHHLSPRLSKSSLFIVGNSLGANIIVKYLGEEGRCGTLPACVAGGVSLGNPSAMDSRNCHPLYSPVIAAGAKKMMLTNFFRLRNMRQTPQFGHAVHQTLSAVTLADFDRGASPIFPRNDPSYPFAFRVGYEQAEDYWKDGSSYHQLPFVSVPLLQLVASDDSLVIKPFHSKLHYNIVNPNVMVMETTCGGHLGWHEAPPNNFGLGRSWADTAMTDFIQAILETQRDNDDEEAYLNTPDRDRRKASELRSRL